MLLFPNAKINLGLNVIEKRADGFHNIETLFVPIGLHDILEFVPTQGSTCSIKITGIDLDSHPGDNLVMKAWQLMHLTYKIPPVQIHLHKIIPVGAGLGGGSADAAFMLKGLNRYFKCNASESSLEQMAASIGSDCAFFIKNTCALGSGRGEILSPTTLSFENYEILLVNPGIHIGTREAYAGIQPQQPDTRIEQLIQLPVNQWQGLLNNDFEPSVFPGHPQIAGLKKNLQDMGATYAAMSGSGSSVYGIFDKGQLDKKPYDFGDWFIYRGTFTNAGYK